MAYQLTSYDVVSNIHNDQKHNQPVNFNNNLNVIHRLMLLWLDKHKSNLFDHV